MKTMRLLIILMMLISIPAVYLLINRDFIHLPWQSERITHVYTELIESSESSLLQTAEFRFKLIFPYDFVDAGDDVDWHYLQRQYDYFPDEYPMRSSREFYGNRELPDNWKYAELYALCRECGIDPAGRGEDFMVISTRTRAGFNFDEDSMTLYSEDSDENVILTLPGPEITAIIIEDRAAENSGYPELEINPEQWSRFITALTPEIGELAVHEGILDLAEETARFLLADLFKGAGMELQRIDFDYVKAE